VPLEAPGPETGTVELAAMSVWPAVAVAVSWVVPVAVTATDAWLELAVDEI